MGPLVRCPRVAVSFKLRDHHCSMDDQPRDHCMVSLSSSLPYDCARTSLCLFMPPTVCTRYNTARQMFVDWTGFDDHFMRSLQLSHFSEIQVQDCWLLVVGCLQRTSHPVSWSPFSTRSATLVLTRDQNWVRCLVTLTKERVVVSVASSPSHACIAPSSIWCVRHSMYLQLTCCRVTREWCWDCLCVLHYHPGLDH